MKKLNESGMTDTLASIPEEEITPEMRNFKPTRLHFIELYEEESLQTYLIAVSIRLDLDLSNYLIADGNLIDIVEDEGQVHSFATLQEVIELYPR